MKQNHTHRAVPEKARDFAFIGPVRQPQNQAAHGNICRHDVCKCGATRKTNINMRHIERGAWTV